MTASRLTGRYGHLQVAAKLSDGTGGYPSPGDGIEQTLLALDLTDRNDPITEIVAKKIIEIWQTGVKDPDKISQLAIKDLAG